VTGAAQTQPQDSMQCLALHWYCHELYTASTVIITGVILSCCNGTAYITENSTAVQTIYSGGLVTLPLMNSSLSA